MSCQQWLNGQIKANWEINLINPIPVQNLNQKEKYFSPWLPKNYQQSVIVPKYQQVFEDKIGFVNNACIVDMLFCCGGKELKQLLS